MAATVKVRNKGPFDRDIKPGGTFGDVLASVPVDGVVEVSAELAGKAPTYGKDDDGNEVVTDPGSGLLAQVDAWEAVTTEKKAEAKA